MPLIHVVTTESPGGGLAAEASRIIAEGIGKPEKYVMALVSGGADMRMSGETGPAAFVDVRSIGGLTPEVTKALSERLCRLLQEELGIAGERVYLNFSDVERPHWGWNGATF